MTVSARLPVGWSAVCGCNISDYTHLSFGVKIQLFKSYVLFDYCKFGNFRENSNFLKNVKRHICHVTNSRLGHDLPAPVNGSDFDILRGF